MSPSIIQIQSGEIDQMTGLLNQWYGLNAQGQPVVSIPAGGGATTNPPGSTVMPLTGTSDHTCL